MAKDKPTEAKKPDLAEWKYIGDDGGRWLFQRRLDNLCITVDKPTSITPKSRDVAVKINPRGHKWRPDIFEIVRK